MVCGNGIRNILMLLYSDYAVFTGLKEGQTTVHYTIDGQSVVLEVHVLPLAAYVHNTEGTNLRWLIPVATAILFIIWYIIWRRKRKIQLKQVPIKAVYRTMTYEIVINERTDITVMIR